MPTPRPIITPIVDVMSGMSTTFDNNPVQDRTRGNDAGELRHAIGNPIASTEPKAMIRMTMAKFKAQRASDDGTSNSANACPPNSISHALEPKTASTARISSPIEHRLFERHESDGACELGVRGSGPTSTPSDAICRSLPGVYGLASDCTPSILATSAKNGSITRPNVLILDPVVRFEHDVADLARPLPTELVIQDLDAPLALHVREREVGAVTAPHRPHHRAEDDDPIHQ